MSSATDLDQRNRANPINMKITFWESLIRGLTPQGRDQKGVSFKTRVGFTAGRLLHLYGGALVRFVFCARCSARFDRWSLSVWQKWGKLDLF